MAGCVKKYTDPSSLRKHVKNHTYEEQRELKNRAAVNQVNLGKKLRKTPQEQFGGANYELPWQVHQVTSSSSSSSSNVKQDLKNKISEKNRLKKYYC